jgi:D-glycero-alpha-D-manno-heptose-7-phosphate kinase
VLFYTGKSRESAKIIESQIKSVKESRSDPVLAMKVLKNDALLMKEAFLKGEFHKYADLLRSSWDAKKRLSASVSNPFLNSIYDSALSAGAVAGKISGAGGGGFFMFFVPPKNRLAVVRKLGAFNGDVINFHFTSTGVQSWTCTL